MLMEHERRVAPVAAPPRPGPDPFVLECGGEHLYATYHPARGEPPLGPRVAVLVLEQLGPHRMNLRLTRALTTAGYPVLSFDFRGRGESSGAGDPNGHRHLIPQTMVDDARVALAELRRRADAERIVLFGACQAGHVAARVTQYEEVHGLVLAGVVNFDDFFRDNYRGVMPGMARVADIPNVDLFEELEDYRSALLLVHGGADPYMAPPRLLVMAHQWEAADAARQFEMRIVDGSDHTFSSRPREQVLIREAVTWLERRFGPGYPHAWQGPPPAREVAPPARAEGIEVQVPLLATGAVVVPVSDGASGEGPGAWRLELPEGRAFALTDALRRLVGLVDGHRPVGAIAAELSAALGRPISAEQVGHLLRERLAPLGVLEPDARGEGGEEESGMTDILIRCYEAHDRLRELLDNLTRVTRSPYNLLLITGKRSAVLNQNVGLERARTRYAVFLDDDVLLTEGWLERLRETMDRTGAGAVSARQLSMDGTPLSSGAACQKDEIVEICFGGACFMFRTDLGLRFDETFVRSQWDDFDFIFQFYELGYKAYIDGRVEFYHHADPKICQDQNYDYFVRKWTQKGLSRGLMFCRYPGGHRGYLPNFGA